MNYKCNNEPYVGMPIYLEDCDCDDFLNDMMECEPNEPPCMAGQDFENWPLAMAYVPMQPWEEPYPQEQALQAGTIFPSLDLPFLGGMKR